MKIYNQLERLKRVAFKTALFSTIAGAGIFGNASAQSGSPGNYCLPYHGCNSNPANSCTYNYNISIEEVELNTLLQTGGGCPHSRGSYAYWNNGPTTTLGKGAEYTARIKTSANLYTWNNSVGVWIDFNGDNVFSNAEFCGTATAGASGSTYDKTFTVPCNAVTGVTRMRVRTDAFNPLTAAQSCNGNYCYGETWDFDVTIAATSNPTAEFAIPDSVYTNSPGLFVNANQAGYIGHVWDVIGLGSATDGNKTNFTYSFPTAGQYQLRLTSTNCLGNAIKTKTVTVINPTSSPLSNFVLSENEVVYDGTNAIYVDFYDISTFGPTQWSWILTPDMGSGAPYVWSNGTDFSQNPTGFFYDVETYDICLAVGNSAGWDTTCKSAYLQIKAPGSGSATVNIMGTNTGSDAVAGTIYDSGGPDDPYGVSEYHEFLIAPCGASEVTLSFSEFNTENGADILYIYNGENTAAPLLGQYSGTTLPPDLVGTDGKLYLLFLTSAGGTFPGFEGNWTSVVPNNGPASADFTMDDSVFQCSMGNDVYFTNTSTGVVDGQATYDWLFEYDPNVAYPTGYADAVNEENPVWPYFAPGTYNVRMVLHSCEGNDTVVKTFVLAPTSNNPIVDFEAGNTILKVGGITTITEKAVAGCEYEWVINPPTYMLENGSSLNDPMIDISFNAPGSYNIKLIVSNDNGSSVLEKTNYIDVIEYCKPAAFYPTIADVGINEVIIDGVSNMSASGVAPGYSDYTNLLSVDMTLGETYSVEVIRNSNVNSVNRKIWIDYNRDGDFADANELVASQVNSSSISYMATFTIPGINDVILGEARMRVAIGLGGTSLTACGPTQVGEYEDYTIMLVLDNQPPIIQIIGANDTSIEVNSAYVDPGATAYDNIEGDISSEIIADNGVNASQTGVYLVVYNVSDKSGVAAPQVHRKVTVVADLTKPVLTLNGGTPLLWSVKVPFADPGATAVDMPSGANIDHLVTMAGTVDENVIGDYLVTYEVFDDFGNVEKVTRTVQVRDTTKPWIVANPVYKVQVGTAFADPVLAADNYDNTVTPVKVSGTVNTMIIGTYDQSYKTTDLSGNVSNITTVSFEVDDYIKPVIKYTPGTEIIIVKVFDNNWESNPGMGVTADDNYYTFADLDVIYPPGYSTDVVGTYVIIYKATDQSGNEAILERTVKVVDDIRPVIVAEPLNLPRWSTYDFMQGVFVKDNYYSPIDFIDETNGCQVMLVRSNVDFNYPGVYEVSYVAIDGSGNKSQETVRMVNILEGNPNSIEIPESGINVYPNPNRGTFTIAVEGTLAPDAKVSVVNTLGEVVFVNETAGFTNGEMTVSVLGIKPGIYFVRVQTGGQTLNTKVTIQ